MMKKFIVLMALIAMVGLAQAELFVNGDFEAGAWSGWGSGAGAYWGTTAMPPVYHSSGGSDGGAWMEFDTTGYSWATWCTWEWALAWSGIWDGSIPATSGQEFTLSGMAKHVATGSAGNTLRAFVEYKDAGGTRLDYNGDGVVTNDDRYMPTWATADSWGAFSDTFTVPTVDLLGNPFSAPIVTLEITLSVESEAATVGVDELSLIPEPATMALLGLGSMLMLRRRKA